MGREVRPEVLEVRLRHDLEVGLELVQALRGVLELRAVGRGPLLGLVELLLGAVTRRRSSASASLVMRWQRPSTPLSACRSFWKSSWTSAFVSSRSRAAPSSSARRLALARLVEVALQALHEVLGLLHGVLQLAAVRPRLLELRVHSAGRP